MRFLNKCLQITNLKITLYSPTKYLSTLVKRRMLLKYKPKPQCIWDRSHAIVSSCWRKLLQRSYFSRFPFKAFSPATGVLGTAEQAPLVPQVPACVFWYGTDTWVQVTPALIFPFQENISCDSTVFREDSGAGRHHSRSRKALLAHSFPLAWEIPERMPNSYTRQGASIQRGHCPTSAEESL